MYLTIYTYVNAHNNNNEKEKKRKKKEKEYIWFYFTGGLLIFSAMYCAVSYALLKSEENNNSLFSFAAF